MDGSQNWVLLISCLNQTHDVFLEKFLELHNELHDNNEHNVPRALVRIFYES